MNELEKQLEFEKKRLEAVKSPKELEDRLRMALEQTPTRKKNRMSKWFVAVATLLCLSIVSYHYNAFAYYGKKLLGYDEILYGTLAQLNEEGNGQSVDRKVMLSTGTTFFLDGIMTDENQLILYYTLTNSEGITEEILFTRMTGMLTDSIPASGTYSVNEKGTELKGMQTFDAVSPFAKKLTLAFTVQEASGEMQEESVTFPYDPTAAMQTELKQSIKQKVRVDKGVIRFDSITATPSRTTIKGKLKVDNFDRFPAALDGVKLVADGVPIDRMGGSVSSAVNGRIFEIYYDALPKKVRHLELIVDTFVGYTDVNESIPLIDLEAQPVFIQGKELVIRKVERTAEGIEVTIATEQDVMLEGVAVQSKGTSSPLKTTLRQDYLEGEDGKIYKERILLFETNELPETLSIEGMHFEKKYEETIQILEK